MYATFVIFILFYSIPESQFIDASCHPALYCVIIINPMINTYFVSKGGQNFKITWRRGCHVFGFMLLYGIVINVSKNINTLLIGKRYFSIFQIDT